MSATFQNEISPASIRGILGAFTIISVDIASVVTAGINLAVWKNPTSLAFRLPLGIQCLWPFLIGLGMLYVMDSPTSYLIKGDDENAIISLRKIRQGYTDLELEEEMASLKLQTAIRAQETEVPWMDIFRGVNLRRTFVASFIGVFQLMSGLIFATSYATVFLSQIGSADPFLLVFGLTLLSLGGAVAGLFLVDYIGRRNLALSTFSIILIIDTVIGGLGFADMTNQSVIKAIAGFCLMFGFFLNAGFGPLGYLSAAEMPTGRLRNKTTSFALFCNATTSLTMAYVLPYINNPDA
jgi:hypothetical protein